MGSLTGERNLCVRARRRGDDVVIRESRSAVAFQHGACGSEDNRREQQYHVLATEDIMPYLSISGSYNINTNS